MEALESPDRDPIQPQYLMAVVDRLAGDDAILTCDSGTIATWAARHWTIRGDRRSYLSGNLYPEYGVRYERSIDFAQVAQAGGASGVRVERAGDLEAAVRAALDHPGPALVDAVVNPREPPIPGKIEFKQAKGFAEAFLRGQPDKLATAKTLIKDQVDKLRS
jgi:thiamine pyrophosphate-dependent acetolactate synthase large subunit-like protein